MAYWLLKTEPGAYSIDDLKREKVGLWDGVRNYLARNNLRSMKRGDEVLIYHSSIGVPAIVGIGEVVKTAYPDPTQFEPASKYVDLRSTADAPRWSAVDIRFHEKFSEPLTLHELKLDPHFSGMLVTRQGVRLSVQPVSEKHFGRIRKLRSKRSK